MRPPNRGGAYLLRTHLARREGAKDISLGGTFIETDLPGPVGQQLVVHVALPGSKREINLPAVVRWSGRDGMGVQFGLLGARETHEITEFVKANEGTG